MHHHTLGQATHSLDFKMVPHGQESGKWKVFVSMWVGNLKNRDLPHGYVIRVAPGTLTPTQLHIDHTIMVDRTPSILQGLIG